MECAWSQDQGKEIKNVQSIEESTGRCYFTIGDSFIKDSGKCTHHSSACYNSRQRGVATLIGSKVNFRSRG